MIQIDSQRRNEKIALEFINDYVEFCNDRNSELGIIEWISMQSNVTDKFKNELERIITQARKENPELGLGFDPILDAQDYPDNGFEMETVDKNSELITVKGIDWSDFKLNVKMEVKNDNWLVNGSGIVNMNENERIKK
jgi:hypothetical protein